MLNMTGLASMLDINQLTEMLSSLTLGKEPPPPPPEDYTKEIIAGVATFSALAVTCCCVTQKMWARRQMNNLNYQGAAAHIQVDNTTPRASFSNIATSATAYSSTERPLVERSDLERKYKQVSVSFSDARMYELHERNFVCQHLELSDEIKASILLICQSTRASHQGDGLSLLKYAMDVCDALKALLGALPTEDLLHNILNLRSDLSEDDFLKALQNDNCQLADNIKMIFSAHLCEMEDQANEEQAREDQASEEQASEEQSSEEQQKAEQALAEQRAQQAQARATKAKAEAEANRRAQEEYERASQKAARKEARAEQRRAQEEYERARQQAAREEARAEQRRAQEERARADAEAAREQEQAFARARVQEQTAARVREASARAAQILSEQAAARETQAREAHAREAHAREARAKTEAARPVQQPTSRDDLKSKLGAMLAQPPGAAIDARAAAARQQQSLHMSGRAQQRVEVSASVGEVATSAKNATLKKN